MEMKDSFYYSIAFNLVLHLGDVFLSCCCVQNDKNLSAEGSAKVCKFFQVSLNKRAFLSAAKKEENLQTHHTSHHTRSINTKRTQVPFCRKK